MPEEAVVAAGADGAQEKSVVNGADDVTTASGKDNVVGENAGNADAAAGEAVEKRGVGEKRSLDDAGGAEAEPVEGQDRQKKKSRPAVSDSVGAVSALRRRVAELAELAARADKDVDELLATPGSAATVGDGSAASASSIKEKESLLSEHDKAVVRDTYTRKLADIISKQCVNILRTISNHKWSWPFLEPVDPVKLNIPDYFEKIKHPMDLGTVRSRLDASTLNNVNKGNVDAMDSRPYKHPNDVHHDMKLVFDNAMRYNSAGSDVHVMAQTVLDKFEERWRALIVPRVEEAQLQKQRQIEQLVQIGARNRRDEKVVGVAKELMDCEAVMRRTRKAGDELRLLMAMMVSQGDAARRAKSGQDVDASDGMGQKDLLKMTDSDVQEIREALGKLVSNDEPAAADAEASRARETQLKAVITILEEESDEKIHKEVSQMDAGNVTGAAAGTAHGGTGSVTAAQTGTGKASRMSLIIDLDRFDALALRRLQRVLQLGPYSPGGPSERNNGDSCVQKKLSSAFESRLDKSRRRAEWRSLQQQTKEDEELEV